MAAGDWSNTCKLRPIGMSFIFDANEPPNIITVAVQYWVLQPSGLTPQFNRARPLAAPVPIAQGLTAIQQAITEVLQYEDLTLG